MIIIFPVIIILITFVITEFIAWFLHKYVMHGFLWSIHKDHHIQSGKLFQKNDSFLLVFAIPSWLLIMLGIFDSYDYKFWIGLGILIYGVIYFLFHDVLIHKRYKKIRKSIFRNVSNKYLQAIIKAHHAHHKYVTKHDGESFGMLFVHPKYYKLKP